MKFVEGNIRSESESLPRFYSPARAESSIARLNRRAIVRTRDHEITRRRGSTGRRRSPIRRRTNGVTTYRFYAIKTSNDRGRRRVSVHVRTRAGYTTDTTSGVRLPPHRSFPSCASRRGSARWYPRYRAAACISREEPRNLMSRIGLRRALE